MTFFDDILVTSKELKKEIKRKSNNEDFTFIADKIKNWVWHCESYNQNNKYDTLIYNIQYLYNITKNVYKYENKKRSILEYMELIIIELIKLTG